MEEVVKIYLDLPKILYKEKTEYQVFLHIVEDENDLKLVATIASNEWYAIAKAAAEGVVHTTARFSEIMNMLKKEAERIDQGIELG